MALDPQSYPVPQPKVKSTVQPRKAKEQAFYTASLSSPEQMEATFDQVYGDLVNEGYSASHENALQQFKEEQDVDNKFIVASMIEDPTIDKATKARALDLYSTGGFVSQDLKYKYAMNLASVDNSETLAEQEAQTEMANDLAVTLPNIEVEGNAEDDSNIFEETAGNVLSLLALIPETVSGTVDFGLKVGSVYSQYKENGEVDWQEVAMVSQDVEEGVLKTTLELNDATIKKLARFAGLDDEMEESSVAGAFGYLGEKIEWLAQAWADKGWLGVDSKEEAMFAIEALGFIIPAGLITKSAIKKIRHKPGSPADVTNKSNPKVGGDLNKEALVDKDGKLADSLDTTKENIIAEQILPDDIDSPTRKDVVPDINDRVELAVKELDTYDKIVLDTMFDDNLVKRQNRLNDLARRVAIRNDTSLYYNQANSKINFTGDTLDGTMVFTQGPDYAFTSKGSILHQGNKLQELAKEMKRTEIQEGVDAGLGTPLQVARQFKENVVRVRDLRSGQTMTMTEFGKTNFIKGKYQLELDFRKEYDMLSNEMLGQTFKDRTLSFFGSDKLGGILNRSVLGEHLFGTGFTARWFEKSRADLANRSSLATNKLTSDFTRIVVKNKDIKKDIADVIRAQTEAKTDIIPKAKLRQDFSHLSTKQIDILDEAQHAWRKTQDALYEITNNGEKQRLMSGDFRKGLYVDGNYKGAVKELSVKEIADLDADTGLKVYDPDLDDYVSYVPGSKVVQMEGRMKGNLKKNGEVSDYVLVNKNTIEKLPHRVMDKLPGHSFKEYKSNFFIDVIPKKVIENGKVLSAQQILARNVETKGTASTRFEADALIKEMSDPNSKHYIGDEYEVLERPRSSNIDNIEDHAFEYRVAEDNYRNSHTRTENMRVLDGDDVVKDPLTALYESSRRITRTATASQFDRTYRKAFMRDFSEVLDTDIHGVPQFPTSINQINAIGKKGDPKELDLLVADARRLWHRQTAFQRGGVALFDEGYQKGLHHVADILEKVPGIGKGTSKVTRAIGSAGSVGASHFAKKIAQLAYITYQMPLRHWVIQPMMFYEQSILFPKSFKSTMLKAPVAVNLLLSKGGSKILKEGDMSALSKMLPEKLRKEMLEEVEVMRNEGILESIDQNLAVSETVKGYRSKLETPEGFVPKLGEKLTTLFQGTTNKINKFGFAAGELANRVGLWMQNKARWVDDPKNAGKDWRDPINAKEISFEAWKQSGAMNASGALAFQRMPLLSFITQFQSIQMKGLMNVLQKEATNLTAKDRAKLVANRILMHGVEFGVPLGLGNTILEYFQSSDDPDMNAAGEMVARGYFDRFANFFLSMASGEKTDLTLSQSASLGATNAIADTIGSLWDGARFLGGSTDARPPSIPSLKVATTIFEKLGNVGSMFKYNPVNLDTLQDSLIELATVTSAGNNINKAMLFLAADDVLTKSGRSKGFGIGVPEAIFYSMGFKSRYEADQWRQTELMRDINDRIKDQIEDFDNDILVNMKKDTKNTDNFFRIFNLQHSILQQAGVYSTSEMDKIMSGVIAKQEARMKSNDTENLMNWAMEQNVESGEIQKFITKFGRHPDPVVQEFVKMFKNIPQKQLFEEE
jgi:hypothetical protein